MRILSLLHVRSEYDAQKWAAFDTRSARTEFMSLKVHRFYNVNVVIMHGESNGRLKKFDMDAAHSWTEAGFPRALLTFMTQMQLVS
jgi:hypothetical protein